MVSTKELKLVIKLLEKLCKEEPKKSKSPKKIENCKKKSQLEKFKVDELKKWIKSRKIKVSSQDKKKMLISIVWNEIMDTGKNDDSDSDSDSESDSDSDSESDSDSDSDNDSDEDSD